MISAPVPFPNKGVVHNQLVCLPPVEVFKIVTFFFCFTTPEELPLKKTALYLLYSNIACEKKVHVKPYL